MMNKSNSNSLFPDKDKESSEFEIPIGDNFKLNARRQRGSGDFGDIYFGTNTRMGEDEAIKLEGTKAKHPQLFYESKLYMALQGGGKLVLKFSRNSQYSLVWQPRELQYYGNRPLRPKP